MANDKFRVLTGFDYPPNKRAEVGDVVTDLPPKTIKWLLEIGAIETSDGSKHKAVDGDGDGLVQDGTPFERPAEDKTEDKIEPVLDETPAQEGDSFTKTEDTIVEDEEI